MSEPIHVTDAAFEKAVLQNPLPVIVDFWAPWCQPCKMIAPILEKMAVEFDGKVVVAKVNTDENQQWASKYGIMSIPALLFFQNGKVIHQQVGAAPERVLREAITQFLDVVSPAKN